MWFFFRAVKMCFYSEGLQTFLCYWSHALLALIKHWLTPGELLCSGPWSLTSMWPNEGKLINRQIWIIIINVKPFRALSFSTSVKSSSRILFSFCFILNEWMNQILLKMKCYVETTNIQNIKWVKSNVFIILFIFKCEDM